MFYKIQDNSVIYPTDLYLKYNLYLIEKLTNNKNEYIKQVNFYATYHYDSYEQILGGLKSLIKINIDKEDKDYTPLNVMDWEKRLIIFYDYLKNRYKLNLLSIETYSRKVKLERLI